MSTEVYSKRVAVRRELRQADGPSFQTLLDYYRRRGGPGLAEKEATARAARHQLNYQVATHTTVGAPPPQPP